MGVEPFRQFTFQLRITLNTSIVVPSPNHSSPPALPQVLALKFCSSHFSQLKRSPPRAAALPRREILRLKRAVINNIAACEQPALRSCGCFGQPGVGMSQRCLRAGAARRVPPPGHCG